jgi:pimeloyl-ACP methyl ester carboxylesterase
VSEERYTVALPAGKLAVVLHLPPGDARVPCIVACHGLGTSKDGDKYLALGAQLPADGLAVARFDFRGCGESSGIEEEMTTTTRLEDARTVIEALRAHPRLTGRFGLFGSSMGGFVALHLAHERADGTPVVTWNAPSSLADLAESETTDGRGIGVALLLEIAEHRYAETPSGIARHLIVHGEADDVVPVDHGIVLHARAAEPCDLVVVPGADHRFSELAHRQEALAHTQAWFRRFLREGGA